jgi:hypothetical protein
MNIANAAPIHDYQRIDGWFFAREARFYVHQVRRVRSAARFVEIGSWKGRSAVCMAAEIQRSRKPIDFWCVDTWQGSSEHRDVDAVQSGTLYDEFLNNIAPFREIIRPLRTTSLEAAERFDDRSLDFVFIDAAHDYDNVLADIRAWRPKVKPGGVLAGHDYLPQWPGVVRAVEEAFDGRARRFGPCWYLAGAGRGAPWSWREFRNRLRGRLIGRPSPRPLLRHAA